MGTRRSDWYISCPYQPSIVECDLRFEHCSINSMGYRENYPAGSIDSSVAECVSASAIWTNKLLKNKSAIFWHVLDREGYELWTNLLVWGIIKCGGSPIGFAGFEYGLWGINFGGPLSVMKVPRAALKSNATSSYSVHPLIFVGYSCHDDPMLYSTKFLGELGYPSDSEDLAFLFAYSDPSSKKIHHPHLLNCPQYECSFLRLSQRYVKSIHVSTWNLSPSLQKKYSKTLYDELTASNP